MLQLIEYLYFCFLVPFLLQWLSRVYYHCLLYMQLQVHKSMAKQASPPQAE
jgi:hypothetical protein